MRRLLADVIGKKLVVARLGAVDRVRTLIRSTSSRDDSFRRVAASGILEIVANSEHPAEVRARLADILEEDFGEGVFKQWAADWRTSWNELLAAVLADHSLSDALRILVIHALEARVLEEPGVEMRLTALLAHELSAEANSTRVRHACLAALADIHRSHPSWLADLRRNRSLATHPLPTSDAWQRMSPDEQTLAAVLCDARALEDALVAMGTREAQNSRESFAQSTRDLNPKDGALSPLDALDLVSLHVRYDASAARGLVRPVASLIRVARAIDWIVVGEIALRRHVDLMQSAIAFARSRGQLDLSWVSESVIDASLNAASLALALETAPNSLEHLEIWNDHFRDNGRGFANRLLEAVRTSKVLDESVARAWIALAALKDVAAAQLEEATTHALALLAKSPNANDTLRIDTLIAMVAPEHVAPLQESRVLRTVDVPTREEYVRLYKDDPAAIARRVRLSRLAEVLEKGTDLDRLGTALLLVPHVVHWLPREIIRFEPLVRKHIGNERSTQPQQRKLSPADPNAIGHVAFEAWIAATEEVRKLPPARRPPAVVAHLTKHIGELTRAAFTHGHPIVALAPIAVALAIDTIGVRELAMQTLRDVGASTTRRLDAWNMLDALAWPDKDDELGALLEPILTNPNEKEIGSFLVEPFAKKAPDRFRIAKGRLRVPVPPIEHLLAYGHEDRGRLHDLRVVGDRRDAISTAVSPEDVVSLLRDGEPLRTAMGAILLAAGVIEEHPRFAEPVRQALVTRIADTREYETLIEGQRETLSVGTTAFDVWLSTLGPAQGGIAAKALQAILDATLAEPSTVPHARAIAIRFAESAEASAKEAALVSIDDALSKLFESSTFASDALEGALSLHVETAYRLGGEATLDRLHARLRAVFLDRNAKAGARYAAYRIVDAADLVDEAVRIFFDEGESASLRALLGTLITIAKPEAFEKIVDMNTQPWTLREHGGVGARLPASNLAANMPVPWLIATLRLAEHDDPHHRAVLEVITRLSPSTSRAHEWTKVKKRWAELTLGAEADVRRNLRAAIERPEPKHLTGRHAHAARLLALFGDAEDEALLADIAGKLWIERVPDLDVFWRPAGKPPALNRYSFLEPYLEVGFGSMVRYRILAEAYVRAAERAEERGEGGTASRFAYEAFLLAPHDDRVAALLERLK